MMVRWMRWHCPPDTGCEIRALAVWGRARYLSVAETPHNVDSLRVSGVEFFCFFESTCRGWWIKTTNVSFWGNQDKLSYCNNLIFAEKWEYRSMSNVYDNRKTFYFLYYFNSTYLRNLFYGIYRFCHFLQNREEHNYIPVFFSSVQ